MLPGSAADFAASHAIVSEPQPQESPSPPAPVSKLPHISVTGAANGNLPAPAGVDAAILRAVPPEAATAAAEPLSDPEGARTADGNIAAGGVTQSEAPDVSAGSGDVASADSSRPSERQAQHADANQREAQPASGGIPFRQPVADRPAHAWLLAPASSTPFHAAQPPPLPVARASWLPPPQFTSRLGAEPQAPQRDAPPLHPLPSPPLPAFTPAAYDGASTGAAGSPAAPAADRGETARHEVQAPVGTSQSSAPAAPANRQPPLEAGPEAPVVAGGSPPLAASPVRAQAPGSRPAGDALAAPDALAKAAAPPEAASAGETSCVGEAAALLPTWTTVRLASSVHSTKGHVGPHPLRMGAV